MAVKPKQKIKVLFYNQDEAGVNYYRTLMPARQLQKDYGDEFEIEINPKVDWNDFEYLKQFQIIHAHRSLCDYQHMDVLVAALRKAGVKVVIDLDDYWELHEEHPVLTLMKTQNAAKKIINNLRLADYVTTTTPQFASYIKAHNKNVMVLENAIDDTQAQFQYEERPKADRTRLMWLGGSSHEGDVNLLADTFDRMRSDAVLKDKYQLHLSGFDLRGTMTNITVNEDLLKELFALYGQEKLQKIYQKMVKVNFNLLAISEIPAEISAKYTGNVLVESVRNIYPQETVWSRYEEVFTSGYKLISDPNYVRWLMRYDLNGEYPNQKDQPYVRHKTQGIHQFANNYRNADVALAPLKVYGKIKGNTLPDNASNRFQFAKSNLKAIEAGFHKVPLVCSQVPTYTFDSSFQDGKNIVFVKPERQTKDWFKKIKELVLNPALVEDLGEAAYETVREKYALRTVTRKRAEFYKRIVE